MNPKEIRKFKVMLAESGRQLFVLQEYIKERPDTELCGAACDGEALLELLSQGLEPDVLILILTCAGSAAYAFCIKCVRCG